MRLSLALRSPLAPLLLAPFALFTACSSGDATTSATSSSSSSSGALPGTPVAADTQRDGDPKKGYDTLVNGGYITCGIPLSLYQKLIPPAPMSERIPGRTGKNATLPYYFSVATTKSGVDVVNNNCLQCHAGKINGQIVVGLGASDTDYGADPTGMIKNLGSLLTDPKEKTEFDKFVTRVGTIGPNSIPLTIGVNPADSFTAVLFAHHDQKTLAWSDKALLDVPPAGVVPVHVPAWWRMSKKHAMFYNGAGRGDHARIEMTASLLCTDTVEEATSIDAMFTDVRAFVETVAPPKYPFAVDQAKAAQGKGVFESTCSRCHGTYGDGGSYPNLLIATSEVGTDDTLSNGAGQYASDKKWVDWYNGSFWGQKARLEPTPTYVAPPLDGIWATAPYLHNGSVPTIAVLLDSTKRPKFWSRTFDDKDYDQAGLGWNFKSLPSGQDAEADPKIKKTIYDTTKFGYGNAGHTYGDGLTADERGAVLEYLKTL